MAVTNKLYGPAIENLAKAGIPDLSAGGTVIKVALMDDTFTFNQDHEKWGDIKDKQISDVTYTDYTEHGETIANKQVNYLARVTTFKTTDAKATFCDPGDIKASYAVIYYYVDAAGDPHDDNSKLIACIDFDGELESKNGEFSIEWHNDGIFTITVAS